VSTTAFKYCLNTSTIREQGLSLPEMIRVTADAGYDGIEPWVREIDAFVADGGSLDDLAAQLSDAGLAVPNLIGFFEWAVPDEARRQAALDEARRNMVIARKLSCPYLAAPPMGMVDQAGADLVAIAERYAHVVELGRDYGVIPMVEFWGHSKTLSRLGEALLVAAESGQPEACILADVFHTYKGSETFEGFRLVSGETVALLHMNDVPPTPGRADITDAARVYPGDGIAPLQTIMKVLTTAGFTGMLSLELFNEDYWKQAPRDVAATGLRKMQAVVAGMQ